MANPQRAEPALLHDVRFPGEGDAYRAARDALLRSEIALRRQTEAVAAERRASPLMASMIEVQLGQGCSILGPYM